MTFTPGFKNDIFISYCHKDNEPLPKELPWVDCFHESLKISLRQRFLIKDVSIWRDKELHGSTVFDNKIQEQIHQSAIFLALVSPNYLDSEYCIKELAWFHNEAKKSLYGLSINHECRIFNILLYNINHAKWPAQLNGPAGFKMHDEKEGSEKLGAPLYPGDLHYREMFRKIVDAVEKTLNMFPGAGDKVGFVKENVIAGNGAMPIFIAHAADPLQKIRDKLVEDLGREELFIFDEIPPPRKHIEHKNEVQSTFEKAALAVHLLDGCPGGKIDDMKSLTYPRTQVEIGLLSPTPQLVWIPQNLEFKDIEDMDYAGFLESLDRGTRQKTNFEFIREEKTNLPHLVMQKIKSIRQQQQSTNGAEKKTTILLDTVQNDQLFALKLALFLAEKGFNVNYTTDFFSSALNPQYFAEMLKLTPNLVIIYGSMAPQSILERLKIVIKLVCEQMIKSYKTSLENRWICMLPSSRLTPEIENVAKEFRINLLDNRHSDNPDEEVLKPLLGYCKPGGAE